MSDYRLGISEEDEKWALTDPSLSDAARRLLDELWTAGGVLPDQLFVISPELREVKGRIDTEHPLIWRYDRLLYELIVQGFITVATRDDSIIALPVACWGHRWTK